MKSKKKKLDWLKSEPEREREEVLAQQQEKAPKSTETAKFDPETGEILDSRQLSQNQQEAVRGAENGLKRYTQNDLGSIFRRHGRKRLFQE